MKKTIFYFFSFLILFQGTAYSVEIQSPTNTLIHVRENTKTQEPYISIVDAYESQPRYAFQREHKPYARPNYRLLSHKVKNGEIPYDGPVSDRKKVYVLAGSLAAAGIATAVIAPAASGVAATGAGAGGAGVFFAGGTAVATSSIWAVIEKSKPNPTHDSFIHRSQARIVILNQQK